MKKTQFTTAPWQPFWMHNGDTYIAAKIAGNQTAIAEIITTHVAKTDNANAYLMSAAPEMYEALEDAEIGIRTLIKLDPTNKSAKRSHKLIQDALKKARGES